MFDIRVGKVRVNKPSAIGDAHFFSCVYEFQRQIEKQSLIYISAHLNERYRINPGHKEKAK